MNPGEPTAMVELVETSTSFEADAIAAALHEADIGAVVIAPSGGIGGADPPAGPVSVRVPANDLGRARDVLTEREAIDWSDVDVGTRTDDLPLTPPGHMPVPARIALVIALIVAVMAVIGGVLVLLM